jgi:hypothetical protein
MNNFEPMEMHRMLYQLCAMYAKKPYQPAYPHLVLRLRNMNVLIREMPVEERLFLVRTQFLRCGEYVHVSVVAKSLGTLAKVTLG